MNFESDFAAGRLLLLQARLKERKERRKEEKKKNKGDQAPHISPNA